MIWILLYLYSGQGTIGRKKEEKQRAEWKSIKEDS